MTDAAVPALTLPGRVIQALLAGEQVIDLRMQPDGGGPPVGATRFWLKPDPGAQPELKPAYERARELSLAEEVPGPGQVRIDGWAELAGRAIVHLDDKVRSALEGKTILALDPLVGHDVVVLALRAHRLAAPATVPAELDGLPVDPSDGPATEPALSDTAFQARLNGIAGALPGGLQPA